jgi:23S rRNA pseudouridine1911/1915/1917 synthase
MRVSNSTVLLDFLLEKSFAATKTNARQMVKLGRITVDGLVAIRADMELRRGQDVQLLRKAQVTPKTRRQVKSFEHPVLFEDKFLCALSKPSGLLAVGVRGQSNSPDFYSFVRAYYQTRLHDPSELHYVHGHDRGVSGIMLFARNELTKSTLKKFWHQAKRRYVCLVEGEMPEDRGTLRPPVVEDGKPISAREQASFSNFKVLKRLPEYTVVEIEPFYEQKYQIRKQLASLGCPIAGDRRFGSRTNPLNRLALHLFHINFPHPVTKESLKITTPIPKEFLSPV